MTDILLGIAATIAFYNLSWNIGALVMGVATIASLWLHVRTVEYYDEE